MTTKELEQTLVLIKPDALKLSLTGFILSQFSEFHTGLRYAGARVVHVTRMLAEEHYAEHKGKYFYPSLIEYIMGRLHYREAPHKRRVIAIVYCGPGAVGLVRKITGPTNPHQAREEAPGTIRTMGTVVPVRDGDGKVIGERMDNLVHASASDLEAEREIKLWFKPTDLMPPMRAYPTLTCERHYYHKEGKLSQDYRAGSTSLMGPGDVVWQSDLEALDRILQGSPASCSLDGVAAKYLVNRHQEPEARGDTRPSGTNLSTWPWSRKRPGGISASGGTAGAAARQGGE